MSGCRQMGVIKSRVHEQESKQSGLFARFFRTGPMAWPAAKADNLVSLQDVQLGVTLGISHSHAWR